MDDAETMLMETLESFRIAKVAITGISQDILVYATDAEKRILAGEYGVALLDIKNIISISRNVYEASKE